MASRRLVLAGLRRWAAGSTADEAAVELLATAFGGRLCDRVWPWVRLCRKTGWYYLDGTRLAPYGSVTDLAAVLDVAGALVDDRPVAHPEQLIVLPRREALAVQDALDLTGRTQLTNRVTNRAARVDGRAA